jgi:ATPase subunit of ABC transporter with duplicated ATPase domains
VERRGWVAEGARVGYLPQEPQLDEDKTVRENVMEGRGAGPGHPRPLQRTRHELLRRDRGRDDPAPGRDRGQGLWDLDSKVDQAMDALRCPPDDWPVDRLSGASGAASPVQAAAEQPELLLLDEPTNHLDAETVAWLEGHLRTYPGAILIVTHDRYFLDNVTGWILELDRGRGIPYEGNYSSWLGQKQKRLAQEGREEEAHRRTIEREQEWVRASPKARQAKSKARIQRYDDLVAKANEKGPTTAQIIIPVAERLGNNVIEFDSLKEGDSRTRS